MQIWWYTSDVWNTDTEDDLQQGQTMMSCPVCHPCPEMQKVVGQTSEKVLGSDDTKEEEQKQDCVGERIRFFKNTVISGRGINAECLPSSW